MINITWHFKWVVALSTVILLTINIVVPSLNNKSYSLKTFRFTEWLWRYINELIIVSKQVFHHTFRSQEEFQNRFFLKHRTCYYHSFKPVSSEQKMFAIAINELIRPSHSQNRFLFWAATENKHCYIFVYEYIDYPPQSNNNVKYCSCLYKHKSSIITFNSEGKIWRHGAQTSCVVSCCLVYSCWYALQPPSIQVHNYNLQDRTSWGWMYRNVR